MKQSEIQYQTPEYPLQLRLDTSTACNATCVSCHRFLSHRRGVLPSSLLDAILDDAARMKVPLTEIIPVNYGEFFCNPKWESILQAISLKLPKTRITIPTNGSLLDADKVERLCKIPTVQLINFSVNAYFEETYEAFMGLPASNLRNIERMLKLIKVLRPDIKRWVSMVASPFYQTDLERDKFKEYWKDKADAVWLLSASSAGREGKGAEILNRTPCRSIFSDIVMGYDGKLSSCCWDADFSLPLGEYTGDLHKDWHNEKLEAFRLAHNEGRRQEYPLCKVCTSA